MNFYQAHLVILVAINACLVWSRCRRTQAYELKVKELPGQQIAAGHSRDQSTSRGRSFQLNFLVPYALAVSADWLQGPHIYAIYKYDMDLPEKLIAALYATGFMSGALSASFAGGFADRYGRKLACLFYCALYMATCLTMLSESLPLLFLGRFAGGICTTLLFSVFEAWMISDYHAKGLTAFDWELNSAFATMTTLSCAMAIVSGVFGDMLVQVSGNRTWPFIAAVVCCLGSASLIMTNWTENYGINTLKDEINGGEKQNQTSELRAFFKDPRVLSIGITSCVFEGTMYLFIFFWSAALKSTRNASGSIEAVPFGLIFSNFMCAMMTGSTIFTHLQANERKPSVSISILHGVLLIASCSLSMAVISKSERMQFWAFCLLEACVGAYFPAIASIKNDVIANRIRGRGYSILRFPLNIFVIVAHSLDQEGDAHRNNVFLVCGSLLLMTCIITQRSGAFH